MGFDGRSTSGEYPHPGPPAEYRRRGRMATRILVALLSALVLGCDKSDTKSNAPLQELRLGYFANATHAQAVLGVDSGDFAQGIGPAKLSTKVFNAGPSLIEALFSGEIDIGYVGPGPAISAPAMSQAQGRRV